MSEITPINHIQDSAGVNHPIDADTLDGNHAANFVTVTEFEDTEQVISASLNDLNRRIISIENNNTPYGPPVPEEDDTTSKYIMVVDIMGDVLQDYKDQIEKIEGRSLQSAPSSLVEIGNKASEIWIIDDDEIVAKIYPESDTGICRYCILIGGDDEPDQENRTSSNMRILTAPINQFSALDWSQLLRQFENYSEPVLMETVGISDFIEIEEEVEEEVSSPISYVLKPNVYSQLGCITENSDIHLSDLQDDVGEYLRDNRVHEYACSFATITYFNRTVSFPAVDSWIGNCVSQNNNGDMVPLIEGNCIYEMNILVVPNECQREYEGICPHVDPDYWVFGIINRLAGSGGEPDNEEPIEEEY